MHGEREGEVMRRLAVLGVLEVVTQHLFVFGSNAVVDDLFGTLTRTLATEIRYTLLGDDNLDGVLGVVEVGDHRHDRRDSSVLRRRCGRKDREVRVAREVARTADTVHHLCARDVGGVDITVDIRLQRRVDGDDTQTACHLRTVRSLLRTEQELVAVEIEVCQHLRREQPEANLQ